MLRGATCGRGREPAGKGDRRSPPNTLTLRLGKGELCKEPCSGKVTAVHFRRVVDGVASQLFSAAVPVQVALRSVLCLSLLP